MTFVLQVAITVRWWKRERLFDIRKEFKISTSTITAWTKRCREVAIHTVIKKSEPIGGPGVVVEIDESKFGKRK
jgi:hypothetical protein